jgi:hypothetical protein
MHRPQRRSDHVIPAPLCAGPPLLGQVLTVSSAGFEFDGGRRRNLLCVTGVQFGSAELEPVDEQPHPVPVQWLHAVTSQEVAELFHRVGPALHPQHPCPSYSGPYVGLGRCSAGATALADAGPSVEPRPDPLHALGVPRSLSRANTQLALQDLEQRRLTIEHWLAEARSRGGMMGYPPSQNVPG